MEDDPVTEATDSLKPADSGETTEMITNEPSEQSTDNAVYDENNIPVVDNSVNETEEETMEKEQEMDTDAGMAKEMLTESQAMGTLTEYHEQSNQQDSMETERTVVSEEPVKTLEEDVVGEKKDLPEEQVTKCMPLEENVTEEKEQVTEEQVTTAGTSEEKPTISETLQSNVESLQLPFESNSPHYGTSVLHESSPVLQETSTFPPRESSPPPQKEPPVPHESSPFPLPHETTTPTCESSLPPQKEPPAPHESRPFPLPHETTTPACESSLPSQKEPPTPNENSPFPLPHETATPASESSPPAQKEPPVPNESSPFPLPHETTTPAHESSLPPQKEPPVPHESSPFPLPHETTSPPHESSLPPQKGPPLPHESSPLPVPHETSLPHESSFQLEKETDNSELEQLASQPQTDQAISDNESLSNDAKVPERTEIKVNEEFKKLNQISSEETSNSSWYKMPENKEETMDVTETGLLGDENSNMSIPENASVVSSNIGDNSVLSYQVDESSNLSIPDDGNSVPTFSGHQPVFDESANMNPPSNVTFVQPDTPGSVNADTMSEATPTSKRLRRGTLQIAAEDSKEHGHNITAADIYEYQWPQENDADWFILQEQISVYLDVKSFKRKYPEIFRRVCDKLEKDFLREKGVVTETQSDLGLTALKSEDVHDLMSRDYPAKYKEFLKILHDREKKRIAEKLKEYDAPRLEKEKMIEYTKRAMKSASDWNRKMLKERSKERRAYFDMQTFAIHYPKGKFRKLQNIRTPQSSYPVSLIPGQFQEHYRKYGPSDLKQFPLNTTVFNPPKKIDPVARLQQQIVRRQKQQLTQPQSVTVQRNILERSVTEEPNKAGSGVDGDSDNESNSGISSAGDDNKEKEKQDKQEGKPEDKAVEKLKKKEKSSSREASKEKSVEPIIIKKESIECRICKDEKDKSKVPVGEGLITCSECHRAGHPSCLDLTDSMVTVIKTYPWQCMECKTCVQCMDPYDEDKMLFCDNCDRGYHTFCVGLKSLPTGKWECKSCTGDTTPITPLPRPPPKSKRGRKPKDPNNPATTPAKTQKEKDKDKENSVKQTPTRFIPRRESRTQENSKDAKETKETK